MTVLVGAYWWAVGFVFVFIFSTLIGRALGFSLRESMAVAAGHAFLITFLAVFFFGVVELGLFLGGVTA